MAQGRQYVDRWYPYLDETERLLDHMNDESSADQGAHGVEIDSDHEHGHHRAATAVTMDDSVFSGQLADAFSNHCHPLLEPQRDRRAEKTLIFVSILTVIFIAAEFVGGYIANSLAIMTDAGHMLSDLLSFLISLFAIYVARRPATMRLSFGFYRAEILGAVCSIFIIWVLTGILVYLAIIRVIHQDFEIDPNPMLITAAVGVVFNIIMGVALHYGGGGHGHSHFGGGSHSHSNDAGHGHAHGHGHGHDHGDGHGHSHGNGAYDRDNQTSMASHESSTDDTIPYRRQSVLSVPVSAYPNEEVSAINRQKNINVRAAFVHVIGDLVQSIGVMIAALVIKFTGWKLADPVCTFLFSVLVLITTLTVMRDAVIVLMEGTPRDVNYAAVKNDLQKIKGVKAAHSLHMWSLTMDKAALAVHLAIDATEDALKIMQKANRIMRYKYNVAFTTVQVEPFDSRYMTSCEQCVGPVS